MYTNIYEIGNRDTATGQEGNGRQVFLERNARSPRREGARKLFVCCSVLQCVAVCCSVLPCVTVCCSVLQCIAVRCSVLQCVLTECEVAASRRLVSCLCVAVCCSVLQCVTVCCRAF